VLWKFLLKTAALPSVNTVPKYMLVYALVLLYVCSAEWFLLHVVCRYINKGILWNCIHWWKCSSFQQKFSKCLSKDVVH
jgi:hypothetical protein